MWPEELRLKENGTRLAIRYDTGESFEISAELLRVESPSAEVKGHGPGQEVTVPGKRHVRIVKLDPVGNYAVRISFHDGHNSGLYTWSYLAELGRDQEAKFAAYLKRLEAKGLGRG